MFRCLLLCVAGAMAMRRDAKVDPAQAVGAMDGIQSLIEQQEGTEMAEKSRSMVRSFQQLAMSYLGAETPGVKSGLGDIVATLEADVVKKIESDHTHTQSTLDQDVSIISSRAGIATTSKGTANTADLAWQNCVKLEKQALQDVVDAEDVYNDRTADKQEPCQKERDASFFTLESTKIIIECDIDDDPSCTSTVTSLDAQLAALKAKMLGEITNQINAHTVAVEDCDDAVKAESDQLDVVKGKQQTYGGKHNDCQAKLATRDTKICTFGDRLRDVCSAEEQYSRDVADTQGNGTTMSVSDRQSEWRVTQLVICLLDKFTGGSNITDETVSECEGSISMANLTLDLREIDVENILKVPENASFQITCQENASYTFHGGIWVLPADVQINFDYGGQVPSPENETLKEYIFNADWNTKYMPSDADGRYFSECGSSTTTCEDAGFDCGKFGLIPDAVCATPDCSNEECCTSSRD